MLLFTSKGRVYWLKVYEIPEAAAATRGKAINSIVRFQEGETLTAVVPARNLEETGRYVFLATKNGTVKKTELAEFSNPRPSGIIAIGLDGSDELIGAKLTDGKHMVFLASHDGQAILFRETEVRAMGRQAGGVNGMDLAKDDYRRQHGRREGRFRDRQRRNTRKIRRISTSSKATRSANRSHRSCSPWPKRATASARRSPNTASPPAAARA
jgi:DNA gyrase/topoisomerase IV subunit A